MTFNTVLEEKRLINSAELRQLVPFSASYIWRLEQRGRFPKRIKIGERAVAWSLPEVLAWIEGRKKAAR